ncbi:dsDNA nuclease domain-containing protein [Paenibacillus sp. RC21]|uniref:dsDNA nuclease domain-containing protein n=1 Tax=Paenibacillus sp. RC21 TaxID=3156312 RepID=UPI003838B915
MSESIDSISFHESFPHEVLSETDPGDETQKRFRYQHTYTALVAFQMYNGNLPYKELFCEHHEDILAVKEDGTYHGIQIKTRQITDGAFEIGDSAVINSLTRFVRLLKKFPKRFSKFIIVSNCPFRNDDSGKSLVNLLNQVKKGKSENFTPRDLNKHVQSLILKSEASMVEVLSTLAITEVQTGPGMDDIDAKVINDHIGKSKACEGLAIERLRLIHRLLCEKIYGASSKRVENAVKDYSSLIGGNTIVNAEEINTKRITKHTVALLVEDNVKGNVFLSTRGSMEGITPSESSQLMRYKLACGLVDVEDIDIMDDLRASAEDYFIENSHRAENKVKYLNEYHQIRKIVTNQSVEAKSRCRKTDAPYGTNMLQSIEDRLDDISKNRKEDVFHSPYEILKGLVGVLTNECKIAFSKEPIGGWKNRE